MSINVEDFGLKRSKINILMSGPLRPNIETVIENIKNIKFNFPNCRIFICTWNGYKSGGTLNREDDPYILISNSEIDKLKNIVEHLLIIEEPKNEDIQLNIKSKTIQQTSLPLEDEFNILSKYNIYKMFFGIRKLVDYLDNLKILNDDDIAIRYRSDLHIDLDIKNNMNNKEYYLVDRISSGVNFDDWFSISSYKNFKNVWYFENDDIYQHYVSKSFNAEDIVKKRVIDNEIKYNYIKPEVYYLIRNEKIWGREKYYYNDFK